MIRAAWRRAGSLAPVPSFRFDRRVVVIHSDDWGRVGVRDREGFDELRAAGVPLGTDPYDFYTLETATDVAALCDVLIRHRDSVGRSPAVVMNTVVANVDFGPTIDGGFRRLHLRPLAEGLPERWRRPGLLDAYRAGAQAGVLYPALHGLTHFSQEAVVDALARDDEPGRLLRQFFRAHTPYIYHRMPWVGYEYWMPRTESFLPFDLQRRLVQQGIERFETLFGHRPLSACAPGYRANADTYRAWRAGGMRVAQSGTEAPRWPYRRRSGIIELPRTVAFEPATEPDRDTVAEGLRAVARCFARGIPAVVSIHSINFHSSLRDFRAVALDRLDRFLGALERRYDDLLYLHDGDVHAVISGGGYPLGARRVAVPVRRQWRASPALARFARARLREGRWSRWVEAL